MMWISTLAVLALAWFHQGPPAVNAVLLIPGYVRVPFSQFNSQIHNAGTF